MRHLTLKSFQVMLKKLLWKFEGELENWKVVQRTLLLVLEKM